MLYALENLLAAAVAPVLPEGVKVVTGPTHKVPPAKEEQVVLEASRAEVLMGEEDPLAVREPAFLSRLQRWSADGTTRDFTLPADVTGEFLEVEAPPGHPLRRGEDYEVNGPTLRFYRAPAAGEQAVVATLRTGPAEGFHERRPCRLRLGVTAWAADYPRADELLEKALSVVLARCSDVGTLEAANLGAGVRMRLVRPSVLLESLERARVQVGNRYAPKSTALLRLQGELELTVALGTPPPESRIEEIRYTGTVRPL